MATPSQWLAGARPRTLPAAAAPVIVGSAAASFAGGFDGWRALLALGVALALQVGVNYSNDYSDGVRGTDFERTGPGRLTASGTARASQVKAAAWAAYGIGAVLGLVLVILSGSWWLIAVGAAAVAAGWFYTGGKRPYGYAGFGEVGVFVFFGLVAVLGTTYTQAGFITGPAVLGAIGVGLIACALLMVNNIRDIPTDFASGKMTVAVRLGEHRARRAYVAMLWLSLLAGASCVAWTPWALLVLLLLAPAVLLSVAVMSGLRGMALVPVLGATGMYELGYALLLGAALVIGS